MRTDFSEAQLQNPAIRTANDILRSCVHCGFCTATCPTYVLLGDELDSPRGRIYLIKDMLENDRPADPRTVLHVDRCLSCLSCMTTCPSGVHYMHLVDHARSWIESTYRRPAPERLVRRLLGWLLPHPGRFRRALQLGRLVRPLVRPFAGRLSGPVRTMLRMIPAQAAPAGFVRPGSVHPAAGGQRLRVALLAGCVQQVLDPRINDATVRLLTRLGAEVVVPADGGCCGALVHHLGREADAKGAARRNLSAWRRLAGEAPLDAIVVNGSGCGTMLKDYGHLLRTGADREDAAWAASLAADVTEVVERLGMPPAPGPHAGMRVAYHSACSLQHGQQLDRLPAELLTAAGFDVQPVPEGHLCCGSAGTYNLLQPELAERLRARKVANLNQTGAAVVAAGNIGCMVQIAGSCRIPVAHTVELLDWATGGPRPPALG